jgi:hypothetical protein
MNSNAYIVLTEQGLSAIATQPWPQIAIKYFLPMYDESADILIHSDAGPTSASPLSAVITSADTQASLKGERIYKVPSTSGVYSLTSKNVATSAATSVFNGTNVIYSSTVNKTNSRTLFNGSALSTVVSGNVEPVYDIGSQNLQFDGGSAVALPGMTWTIDGSHIFRDNLFDSVSFNPNQVNNGSYDIVNGLFKFELQNDIGSYRFNKIAFFIQPMNKNGSVNSSYDPILFGQVVFDKSQIVEVGGTGSQTFEVAIQLAFTIRNGTTVVTNNDYWSMVPLSASNRAQNGLFFAGDIALGTSAIPNSWQPRAKVHITDNSTTPHMRLSYSDATSGLDIKVIDTGTSGMVSFKPTSGYEKGFGFAFGEGAYAVFDTLYPDGKTYLAFALGTSALAVGLETIALGFQTSAIGSRCVSIGAYNLSTRDGSNSYEAFSFGNGNKSVGYQNFIAVSIGKSNISFGGYTFGEANITSGKFGNVAAIGGSNRAGDFSNIGIFNCFVFGASSSATHSSTYAIGTAVSVASPFSFSIGMTNIIKGAGQYNGALGYNIYLDNNGNSKNWVFGADTIVSSARNSVSIGNGNDLRVDGTALVFGNNNDGKYGGLLIGTSNTGPGSVFGDWSYAYRGSFAIGSSARAASFDSIAIGMGANASYNLANSPMPDAGYSKQNIAIGKYASTGEGSSYCVAIGARSNAVTVSGFATSLGFEARSTYNSVALGAWTKSYGIECVALGFNAQTYATDSNNSMYNQGVDNFNYKGMIAIGSHALAWGENYGIAIGYYAVAKSHREYFYQDLFPAVTVGVNSTTLVYTNIGINVDGVGASYPMSTFGSNLTNSYAGFMAGVNPREDAAIYDLLGPSADWHFKPCVVLGAGPGPSDQRNGVMIGYVDTPTSGTKSAVILDVDNMISIEQGVDPHDLPVNHPLRFAPRGTIVKDKNFYVYGSSLLYIWGGL